MQADLSPARKQPNAVTTICLAGLLAGLLDGATASMMYFITTGNNPTMVFQYIASAIFGRKAFTGGLGMAAWGLLFHLLIALIFAGFFFLIYPVITRFITNKVVIGVLYGLFVWATMNLVIVPSTHAPSMPFKLGQALLNMAILIVMVGLPIALVIHKHFLRK